MSVEEELKALRESIDQVDMELLRLFNRRMELAQEVGRLKAANELTLFVPGREEIIFDRLAKVNPGPLTEESLRAIYREIFAASRLLQYAKAHCSDGEGKNESWGATPAKGIHKASLCGCLLHIPPEGVSQLFRSSEVDFLEWRLDAFVRHHSMEGTLDMLSLLAAPDRPPVIATNRPVREGGMFQGTEEDRFELLHRAVESGAEWVDIEEDAPEEILERFRTPKGRILLSHHDFSGTPERAVLYNLAERMAKKRGDAIKIATFAHSPEDCLRVLELIPFGKHELEVDVVAFCMGQHGRWSRAISLLLGSPWTYVRLQGQSSVAPGQFTAEEMRAMLKILNQKAGRYE